MQMLEVFWVAQLEGGCASWVVANRRQSPRVGANASQQEVHRRAKTAQQLRAWQDACQSGCTAILRLCQGVRVARELVS